MNSNIPVEQGQIVQVRNRRYAVVDVVPGNRSNTDIVANQAQTLVRLTSVEDDGIGEVLSVIWEIEPGAQVFSRGTLPEPVKFDSPGRFDAFMNAVRWGVISAARSKELQSPFRAAIDIEDYQLEPLVRAMQMPRVNLLIADDVGLGKTIESGLIAYELLLRHRIRRILVVCPSSLQVQWHDQMRDKFGLDFKIVNGDLMKELRRSRGLHVNPWNHFPRLITSIDYLKRERPMRLFEETLPGQDEDIFPRRYDLLIVDEAHNVAPPRTGRYATDSQRTRAIRTLVPHFEHRLFLTATPHNGYSESFTALLELLDDQRFARGVEIESKQVRSIMIRRLKTEILHKVSGKPRFAKRVLVPLEIEYADEERKAHAELKEYTKLRRKGGSATERVAVEFVLKLLKKRLFSSPAAFASTLEKHANSAGKQFGQSTRSKRIVTDSILQKHMDRLEEDFGDDDELHQATDEAVEVAGTFFRDLTEEEEQLIQSLKEYGHRAAAIADSKAKKLIDWIKEELQSDGDWNEHRVLIFTEYRDTQKWLLDLFAQAGFMDHERTLSLHGGMPGDEREIIKAAFQANPATSPVRILLATDAASEGIDLQNFCSRLIHFEIPWNPNRMEQRNGRLDRHGQKASEVQVFHFVGAGYDKSGMNENADHLEADLEFLFRAARKVETIREDLGKVGPVIARQVTDAMLGKSRHLDTREAEAGSGAVRKILKWERDLKKQIEECYHQAEDTQKQLRIYPAEIKAVVDTGLELAGKPALEEIQLEDHTVNSESKNNQSQDCVNTHENRNAKAYKVPDTLAGGWARALDGLKHPYLEDVVRPVTFNADTARGRDDVVHAHLNHPLVRLSCNLLRAEVWSSAQEKSLHRITGKRVARGVVHNVSILLHSRFLVLGNDQERLQEELLLSGGELIEGKFKRISKQQSLQNLSEILSDTEIHAGSKKMIQNAWTNIAPALEKALDARVKERTKNLASELEKRKDREVKDITEILKELEKRIKSELNKEEDTQLQIDFQGFNDNEKSQYRKDREHLQRRLARIPDEIKQESRKIEMRYQNIQPRVFPVAITILFPENLDQ